VTETTILAKARLVKKLSPAATKITTKAWSLLNVHFLDAIGTRAEIPDAASP
jgi:hypothetical protein